MEANQSSSREHGLSLLREGLYAESINFLLQALEEEPRDADLYLYTALAYARLGDPQGAVGVLERAIDIYPTSAKLHYNLGVAYHQLHNTTSAKDEYLRALGLDAQYIAAKNALDSIHCGTDTSSAL